MEQKNKKRPMNKILYYSLIGVFAAVFICSAIYLARYFVDAYRHESDFDQLASIMANGQAQASNAATQPQQTESTDPLSTDPEATAPTVEVGILPEYQTLYDMNNDLIGWITVPGTDVNYPVMYRPKDEDYYLYKDFYHKYSNQGSVYVREACDPLLPSDNVTIYGHRMNSGAMFASLLRYQNKAFWQENQTFTFNTLYERHTYQIFAVFKTSANEGQGFGFHRFVNASGEADFAEFVSTVKSLSLYDTGISADYGDMLISLCTCTPRNEAPANGRFVVVAKRIS